MPSPASRRLLRRGLIAGAVVLIVAGGLVAFVLLHAPGNVSNPGVQFTQPTSATTTTSSTTRAARRRAANTFAWPWYGYDAGRTRNFNSAANLRPPVHHGWTFDAKALLEFPPVIWHGTMFMLGDDGIAHAIRTTNGRQIWSRQVGTLAAASPAVDGRDHLIVLPVLSRHGTSPGGGAFLALSMRTGRTVWVHPLPAGSESSPIISGSTVYFGDQSGTLYSMRLRDGHVYWTYHAAGAIKGGPALVGGVLYFGDYAGRVYAIRAVNGRAVWTVGTDGAHFGFGSGQFYATPAVAYGRVYIGNTDGRVYSFGTAHGTLAWATGTGAYVYAAAAVADPPKLGPTVYVGSYDGYLYAFDARSGRVRWRHYAGGRISGAAVVIDGVVYFSVLRIRRTVGLDAATGRVVFSFGDGDFSAAIADQHALYVDGYGSVNQFLPGRAPARRRAHRRRAHRTHRHAAHRGHRRAGRRLHRRAVRTGRQRARRSTTKRHSRRKTVARTR
ncbi:MAG TPA: PQQ-binding-like beta-propeller repeat protein [Solirubrobacteraceae bacterium]|nr:PQQ-binding-like beta-propeller repeat protein [Solirubrobacteraceae bacterium]